MGAEGNAMELGNEKVKVVHRLPIRVGVLSEYKICDFGRRVGKLQKWKRERGSTGERTYLTAQ